MLKMIIILIFLFVDILLIACLCKFVFLQMCFVVKFVQDDSRSSVILMD